MRFCRRPYIRFKFINISNWTQHILSLWGMGKHLLMLFLGFLFFQKAIFNPSLNVKIIACSNLQLQRFLLPLLMAKYVLKMMLLRWPFIWCVYNQEGPLPIFLPHEELYFWKLWSTKYNTDPALYNPWVRGAVEVASKQIQLMSYCSCWRSSWVCFYSSLKYAAENFQIVLQSVACTTVDLDFRFLMHQSSTEEMVVC